MAALSLNYSTNIRNGELNDYLLHLRARASPRSAVRPSMLRAE